MSPNSALNLFKAGKIILRSNMAITTFGGFSFDSDRDLLMRDGEAVSVSHKALLLLKALVGAAGRPVSKQELMDLAWPGLAVEENNLSVQIAGLRKVLGEAPGGGSWILTIPRGGYRFVSVPSSQLTDGCRAGETPIHSGDPLCERER